LWRDEGGARIARFGSAGRPGGAVDGSRATFDRGVARRTPGRPRGGRGRLGEADQLSQVNVAIGLDHLRAYAGEGADGRTFVGLWLRVADGTLLILRSGGNGEDDRFVELTNGELQALTSVV